MRDSIHSLILITVVSGLLAGCGASAGMSTGSLFGASNTNAPPKPVTPMDRTIYVASTTAKAQRCGYYFDPVQLKSNYLASETQAGLAPADLQKLSQAYDKVHKQISVSAGASENYCNSGVNHQVKAALNRQLAGDFTPPSSKPKVGPTLFDKLNQGGQEKKFDGQDVFDRAEGKIKPREE